jgi:hypothetical protein
MTFNVTGRLYDPSVSAGLTKRLETVKKVHANRQVWRTVGNFGLSGKFEAERCNALERIAENVHGSVTFTFQN